MATKDDKRPERGQPNSGQVQHDDRGNAVWQWATDTARTAMASTSQLLRKLDLTGLSLEEGGEEATRTEESPAKPVGNIPNPAKSGKKAGVDSRKGGFDPYSTNAGTAKRAPAVSSAKAPMKPAAPKPPPTASATPRETTRRSSWWQRLLGRD